MTHDTRNTISGKPWRRLLASAALSLTCATASVAQTLDWNYVLSREFSDSAVIGSQGITYFNGKAQRTQTAFQSGSFSVVQHLFFDLKGRPVVSTKPYTRAVGLNIVDPSVIVGEPFVPWSGMSPPAELFSAFQDRYAYTYTTYGDPLDRPAHEMVFGEQEHEGHGVRYEYGIDPAFDLRHTTVTDEDHHTSRVYTDLSGRTARSVQYVGNDSLVTSFRYDGLGRLIETVSPLGMAAHPHAEVTARDSIFLEENDEAQRLTYRMPEGGVSADVRLYFVNDGEIEWSYDLYTCGFINPKEHRSFTDTTSVVWHLEVLIDSVVFTKHRLSSGSDVRMHLESETVVDGWAGVVDTMHSTTYEYNTAGQVISRWSSDNGRTRYVYDQRGLLRFVKDQNHEPSFSWAGQNSYWTYYKYDELGRLVEQGELTHPYSLETLQDSLKIDSWTETALDTVYLTRCDTHRVRVHDEEAYSTDDYVLRRSEERRIDTLTLYRSNREQVNAFPGVAQGAMAVQMHRYDTYGIGLISSADTTQSRSRARLTRRQTLDPNTGTWSEELYVYDRYGRVGRTYVHIPELGSTKSIDYEYDQMGRVVQLAYQADDDDERFFQWFHYRIGGTLDSVWSSRVDNLASATLEAVYAYDDNHGGKMSQVILGNTVQTLNYTYSIRDWLKSVNSNQFSQTLKYDDATVNPRYNGNIAQMTWNTAGNAGAYDFTYDGANRLTDAVTTAGPDFSERLIHYDANGNIQTLKRGTASPINYSYDTHIPNRLNSVSGGLSATYAYDGNGNMTNDNTKGEFIYDYRNMPIKVMTNDTVIEYAYDAAGQRIRKTLKNGGNTLGETIYVRGTNGNIVAEYRNGQIDHFNIYGNGLIGKLVPANRVVTINNQTLSGTQTIQASDSIVVTGESSIDGEITMEAGAQSGVTDKRYYYLPDHLGSTRVVLNDAGNVEATSDYFPFGQISRSTGSNFPSQRFAGYEFDIETAFYRAGIRSLNSALGRFTTTDPAGEFPSPYIYVGNNPIIATDPTGMITQYKVDGEVVYDDGEDNGVEVETTQETVDEHTGDGETDWDAVRNDESSTVNVTNSEQFLSWASGRDFTKWERTVRDVMHREFDGISYWNIDAKKGEITLLDTPSMLDLIGYATAGLVGEFAWFGKEITIGKNWRIAPFGNRTGHPTGRFPHYHRSAKDASGKVKPGGSIKRHRPWDSRSTDKSWKDRF